MIVLTFSPILPRSPLVPGMSQHISTQSYIGLGCWSFSDILFRKIHLAPINDTEYFVLVRALYEYLFVDRSVPPAVCGAIGRGPRSLSQRTGTSVYGSETSVSSEPARNLSHRVPFCMEGVVQQMPPSTVSARFRRLPTQLWTEQDLVNLRGSVHRTLMNDLKSNTAVQSVNNSSPGSECTLNDSHAHKKRRVHAVYLVCLQVRSRFSPSRYRPRLISFRGDGLGLRTD